MRQHGGEPAAYRLADSGRTAATADAPPPGPDGARSLVKVGTVSLEPITGYRTNLDQSQAIALSRSTTCDLIWQTCTVATPRSANNPACTEWQTKSSVNDVMGKEAGLQLRGGRLTIQGTLPLESMSMVPNLNEFSEKCGNYALLNKILI